MGRQPIGATNDIEPKTKILYKNTPQPVGAEGL